MKTMKQKLMTRLFYIGRFAVDYLGNSTFGMLFELHVLLDDSIYACAVHFAVIHLFVKACPVPRV